MNFTTRVELPPKAVTISPHTACTMLGSCFAEHIGRHMERAGLDVDVNPFGVLYNPASIALATQILVAGEAFDESLVFNGHDGLWHSWMHSGKFSFADKTECLAAIGQRLQQAREAVRRCDILFVTFGTNHYYCLKGQETVVANCHKEPASSFEEKKLKANDIIDIWETTAKGLKALSPKVQIVFTISPYRYAKYGLHEDHLSKANMLLAIDEICATHDYCHYFPAYEIITDELRDYRFYERDMLHPTEQAADYVWERLKDWAFDGRAKDYATEWEKISSALAHRPLHPQSREYEDFKRVTMERAERFCKKWGVDHKRLATIAGLPLQDKD